MSRPPLDLKGQRFGRLVAVSDTGPGGVRGHVWHCECDCGGFAKVPAGLLKGGQTRSCGCLYRDTRRTSLALRNRLTRKGIVTEMEDIQ